MARRVGCFRRGGDAGDGKERGKGGEVVRVLGMGLGAAVAAGREAGDDDDDKTARGGAGREGRPEEARGDDTSTAMDGDGGLGLKAS
uniref:Uncharacterized protein n=1 Tax=Oryza sativa subsp. japonica TaxID=39947 RepID=Q69KK5_ORYSJ|nr:hypothetical protein [Oryza sativa Japonica Group]BAD36535.1 hypothetical protein [Oryza sativa Japonica Group]